MELGSEDLTQHGENETRSAPRVKKRKSACTPNEIGALCVSQFAMYLRIVVFLSLLVPAALPAQEEPKAAPPPKQVVLKALQWMQSSEPRRRQAAYRSVHLLGKEAMPSFKKALQKALQYHERRLADTLSSRNRGGNPYSDLVLVMEDLRSERSRVKKMARC